MTSEMSRKPGKRPEYVYRLSDAAGRLLYVGVTWNLYMRLREHSRYGAAWFGAVATMEIEPFSRRADAEQAERRAIESEKPAMNNMHAAERAVWKRQGLVARSVAVADQPWADALRIAQVRGESLNDLLTGALDAYVASHRDLLGEPSDPKHPDVLLEAATIRSTQTLEQEAS